MTASADPSSAVRELVLITGISGSGKSVALHALEDAGYFCVDNLPPELLREYMALNHPRYTQRVAIAVDVRTARSLPVLVPVIDQLRGEGVAIRPMFLDASTDTLVRRFSETRRPHPLSQPEANRLTLVFESFAFKYGVPLDADYVFDVRVLPNPYYVRELRALTGRDDPVAEFLAGQPEAAEMLQQIETFMRRWLPALATDQRGYVTVAIGCTGGQHRSVYMVEQLGRRFAGHGATVVRHRELVDGE